MPSVVLVIVSCLAGHCEPHVITPQPIPLTTCIVASQIEAAKWAESHPHDSITIKCVDPRHLAAILGRTQA